MEDDELSVGYEQPEWWDIDVDDRIVAEAQARLRDIGKARRGKLLRALEAILTEFAYAHGYLRKSIRVADRQSIQWLPNHKDLHHTGRAFLDIDILTTPKIYRLPAFRALSRNLHEKAKQARPIAASLLVLRDAATRDGFSVSLAGELFSHTRAIEQRARKRGERAIRRLANIGKPGREKRIKKYRKQRDEVRRAYQAQPKNRSPAEKLRALKELFTEEPSLASMYAWTKDLRDRDKARAARRTAHD